jgi:T-complex protein 1 subunit theta
LAHHFLGFEDFLSKLIAQACISIYSKEEQSRPFNVDNVRTIKIVGGGVIESILLSGFVTPRAPEGTVRQMKNAKVAVFATGIDASKTETKGVVRMTTAEDIINFSSGEEQFIERIVKEIAGNKIEKDVGVIILLCRVWSKCLGEWRCHWRDGDALH